MGRKVQKVKFPAAAPKQKRVAAYARVSCGKDAMLHSLASQVDYYRNYICRHPGWEYAGVYADEAKTGTKDCRDQFQRMLADCRAGKIDHILTKSISRMARNTVTLLETVRELKAMGISVYFEEQNIDTGTDDGELMLSILASYAQEESLSASENQKWRVRQNFENGQPWRGFMLGYRYKNGQYIVVPEEAEIVRSIYADFLDGKGVTAIMKRLNSEGILTQQGFTWHKSAITRVLKNYTYTGNLLLQTKYRENHLTKRTLVNHGQLPQYHATDTHEPIIDIGTYNSVQLEMHRRAQKYGKQQSTQKYPFSGMITCAGCGKHYRRKVTAAGPVWICSTYNTHGKAVCPSKAIPESTLMEITAQVSTTGEITAITAKNDNALEFTLADGTVTVKQWQDRSRAASWTAEMRAAAGEKPEKGRDSMPKAKNVTMIPATLNLHTGTPKSANVKRRVAGYARVSTDSDEQFTSYTAQVDYYTSYIKRNPDWEFVDVYTDEGISGVSTKNREGFNRMISDALAGKIDLIVTKSVSRFARNTVDSLTTVRKLKDNGIEVYFEKENIRTLDSKGELLITIMSSLAQEESRSISENVTWGQRKRFADGKVSMAYRQFLGYRKGPDGLPEIDPEQAEVVRKIYRLFMSGKTIGYICKLLESEGIPTPGGKTKWQSQTVNSILTNEKYKGSALLQKTYTVDFLTKTMKVNEGEVPQYYVECSHPAIIEPSEWEAVQVEVARRKKLGRRHDCFTPFSGKVICGDCGGVYGSKIWHSTDKYRRVIWRCNHKYDSGEKCGTPHLREEVLKERFLEALARYIDDPEERIEGLRYVMNAMTFTDFIDADIDQAEQDLELLSGMIRSCIMMNASASMTEQAYQRQYAELTGRYEVKKAEYESLIAERKQMDTTSIIFSGILFELGELDEIPAEFKESLWHTLVNHVTVYADERIVFSFKDGTEITTML